MASNSSKSPRSLATITDVAKAAGVSVPTVSRILNNKEYVADETRDRVNEAIKRLGYVPHVQAQRLRGAASRTLALHYPVESPHLLSSVVETPYIIGSAAAAGERDYFLNFLISQLTPDSLLNMYRSNQIDGMILLQVKQDDWRVNLLREYDYPFVMHGRCANLDDLSFIDLDFEAAMLTAFDHLVALGHREIGLLTFPQRWRTSSLAGAIHAYQGYEQALNKYGLQPCFRETDLRVEDSFADTNALLDENPQLTAMIVITANHFTAAGCIKALTQRGYRVPDDISVLAVGFGEFSQGIMPSLTTLEWLSYEASYQAAKIMIDKLTRPDLPVQQILVPPTFVVRDSTGAIFPR